MKKLLFALVALFATLSINAQVIEIYEDGNKIKTYTNGTHKYKAIFKEKSQAPTFTFSVSATKKVTFSKGNLWWDGSTFHFEETQVAYPSTWDTKHVGHFWWSTVTDYKSAAAYTKPYYNGAYYAQYPGDEFWCGENNKISVDGEEGFYALSQAEWEYLKGSRTNAANKYKTGVTVGGIANCLVIAPDQFTGTLQSSYTLEDADEAGLVCLPWAGHRRNDYYSSIVASNNTYNFYCWTSTPNGTSNSYSVTSTNVTSTQRTYGLSLRLVQDIDDGDDTGGGNSGEDTGASKGTAKRTGGYDVNWVQLWENGPKFAEYNVGATSETEVGGYYAWGRSIDKESTGQYNSSTTMLTGTDDTATNLWGSKWRMPTKEEFEALVDNCSYQSVTNYKGSGINGMIFTGKGEYVSNSVFFPAAGNWVRVTTNSYNTNGWYWSSMPNLEQTRGAYDLTIIISPYVRAAWSTGDSQSCYTVRAVLAE